MQIKKLGVSYFCWGKIGDDGSPLSRAISIPNDSSVARALSQTLRHVIHSINVAIVALPEKITIGLSLTALKVIVKRAEVRVEGLTII